MSEKTIVEPVEILAAVYVAICTLILVVSLYVFCFFYRRDSRQCWHHAVRLPSRMHQPYWYLISLSVGCRPWAGHEGDVFLKLIGSRAESRTFIINGEVHSRLWEADSHLYLYSSSWPLGEINYVVVACRSAMRKKRWFLGSIQVKFVSSDPEKEKTWYFPYHEWIEVYRESVKVTLCGVDADHDLNRRLMLGWLGRSFTDFHLWTSIFGPIKYTTFRRNERIGCISTQFVASLMFCSLINGLIPELGSLVLGLFGSTCAMLPVSAMEAVLRRVEWKNKILLEDIKWYKAAEDGHTAIGRPSTYRQFRLKPTHKKMNYGLMFQEEDPGTSLNKLKKKVNEVIDNDDQFWHWLDPKIPLPKSESKLGIDEAVSAESRASTTQEEDEDEDYDVEEETSWFEDVWSKLKNFIMRRDPTEMTQDPDSSAPQDGEVIQAEMAKELKANLLMGFPEGVGGGPPQFGTPNIEGDIAGLESGDDEATKKNKTETILYIGDGFLVEPISIWEVDSEFSVDSMNMDETDLTQFTTMESMPAADFAGFRKQKLSKNVNNFTASELKIKEEADRCMGYKARGGVGNIRLTVSDNNPQWGVEHGSDSEVSDIEAPTKLSMLTAEEKELISWIYYDRCVHENRWLAKGTPLAAVLLTHEDGGGIQEVDWWGVDVDSEGEGEMKLRRFADAFRIGEYERRHAAIHEVRNLYPEPVPRERVFSMLMFAEYVTKLNKAYEQMVDDPEAWSALAQFYAEVAECDEGPALFCEACIQISKLEDGGKIVQNIMSSARSCSAWAPLIIELTQRLRYQGDNVARLKEKYGLDNACLKNATVASQHGYSDFSVTTDPVIKKLPCQSNLLFGSATSFNNKDLGGQPSSDCVYSELERLAEWRNKLRELEIAIKRCPLDNLSSEETRKISRFYRSMLLAPGGCALFGELLRQITDANDKGRRMLARIITYLAGEKDGVPRLNKLQDGLMRTGIVGRRILMKLYRLVESRQPSGPRTITNLANALTTVEMGSLVLKDLQIDASRAHRRAHEVRQSIRRSLDPYIRSTRRNVCRLIVSFNEVTKYMLGVADNSRSVLKDSKDTETISEGINPQDIADNKGLSTIDRTRPVNDQKWNSERRCCRNYRDLQREIAEEKAKHPRVVHKITREPEYFQLSDTSSGVPFVTRRPPKPKPPIVTGLWKPIDDRDDIVNIYNQGKNEVVPQKKEESDPGFIKPCKRDTHCAVQRRMNLNEFFLQSKDYEHFNMNFQYKPTVQLRDLETNFHHSNDFDREIVRCWKPPLSTQRRDAYAGFHNHNQDEEDTCVKWGQDLKEDPQNWGGTALCTCHNTSKSKEGNHECLICSIAGRVQNAETPDQIIDIISDECEDVPAKSASQLEQLPIVGKDTIKNVQKIFNYKNAKISMDTNLQDEDKGRESISGSAPMPSARGFDVDNDTNENDLLSTEAFPFCGTRKEKLCQCVGGDKRRKYPITARTLSMYGSSRKAENSQAPTDDAASEQLYDSSECKDKIIAPLTPLPDTALRRRMNAKEVKFTSRSPSEIPNSQLPVQIRTKDYEFPVVQKTSGELEAWHGRKNDTGYWANDDSDVSVFSRPAVTSESKHCDVCGGLLLQENLEEPVFNYLEQGFRKRQQDDLTIDSTVPSLTSGNASVLSEDSTTFKDAMGCCNTPGCHALPPHGAKYRQKDAKEKKKLLEQYALRKEELEKEIANRHQQWMKETPCGRNFCQEIEGAAGDVDITLNENLKQNIKDDSSVESDASTIKWPPVDLKCVNSDGNLIYPTVKSPLTAEYMRVGEKRKALEEVCEIHKFPIFKCCEIHDSSEDSAGRKRTREPTDKCLCRKPESVADSYTAPSTAAKSHSICSDCHVRVGTQQRPPCTRYLLPLKLVRCYENSLLKYGQAPSEVTDSGLSMNTATDMLNEDDLTPVNELEQLKLLELMGLTTRPGALRRLQKRSSRKAESQKSMSGLENCSVDSSTVSSGVCCHMHSSRLLPVLHLQGFTCENEEKYEKQFRVLSFDWWQRHESALRAMQACADACVCLCIVLAKDKPDGLTEHERTCKVCSVVGRNSFGVDLSPSSSTMSLPAQGKALGPRYSEFLPMVWRSEVRAMGAKGERSDVQENRRPRFYKQLIDCIVESIRIMLLTPDLRPQRLTSTASAYNRLLLGQKLGTEEEEKAETSLSDNDKINGRAVHGEAFVTTAHVRRLAHFRALMKCLNDIQNEGSRLRACKLISDQDVTRVVLLQQQRSDKEEDEEIERKRKEDLRKKLNEIEDDEEEEEKLSSPTFIDLLINFMKNKACGSVLDCRELLEAPWELPAEQQQIAARMLKKIDSVMSGQSASSIEAVDEIKEWEESLSCIVDAYLNEITFRASVNNNIFNAIRQANIAKAHVCKLSYYTRLSVARLVRFCELTQSATSNFKVAMKEGLASVDSTLEEIIPEEDKNIKEPSVKSSTQSKLSEELEIQRQKVKSHIAALLRTGRDDRKATLDDIFICFERLRSNVQDDLRHAASRVRSVSDLGDSHDFWLSNSANARVVTEVKSKKGSLKCWTESESSGGTKIAGNDSQSNEGDSEVVDEIIASAFSKFKNFKKKKIDEEIDRDKRKNDIAGISLALMKMKPVIVEENIPNPSAGGNSVESIPEKLSVISNDLNSYTTCLSHTSVTTKMDSTVPIQNTEIFLAQNVFASSPPPSASGRPMGKAHIDSKTKGTKKNLASDKKPLLQRPIVEEVIKQERVETNEDIPHRFKSVFEMSNTDFGVQFEQDEYTKNRLEAEKGKGMLQYIFGTDMTEEEMVQAFHENIRTLISYQNSSLPRWAGILSRLFLIFFAIGCCIGGGILTYFFNSANYALLGAIPVAIFGHGLILEPLKCLLVSWLLFLSRHKPAFYNNPLYMKSNLSLLQKSQLALPRFRGKLRKLNDDEVYNPKREDDETNESYYDKLCENKASTRPFDRRRRKLPMFVETDIALEMRAVTSYDALAGATPTAIKETECDNVLSSELWSLPDDELDIGGYRREGIDEGGGGRPPSKSSTVSSFAVGPDGPITRRNALADDISTIVDSSSVSEEEEPPPIPNSKHTPIIYCRYSNMPSSG